MNAPVSAPIVDSVTFRFPGGVSGAGLFVFWRVAPSSVASDSAQENQPEAAAVVPFQLGFCDFQGRLQLVLTPNPWPLALDTKLGAAARAGQPPVRWSAVPYQVVLVGHPSPIQARVLLDRLNQGLGPDGTSSTTQNWPIQLMTPAEEAPPKKRRLVVTLPEDPKAYVPRGHTAFGGWTLYRRMPYGEVPSVKDSVRKLAFALGLLRYPVGIVADLNPYPPDEKAHSGQFDPALHAGLQRFQVHVASDVGFEISDLGKARLGPEPTEEKSWAFLHGSTTAGVAVKVGAPAVGAVEVAEEPGVLDVATAQAIEDWRRAGFRNPQSIMVVHQPNPKRTLFGQPELWLRFLATDLTCRALGLVYGLAIGSANRKLEARGDGQVENSFHKLGSAIDLDSEFADAAKGLPICFEADWTSKTDLKWKLYGHSRLPALTSTVDISAALRTARDSYAADLNRRLGDTLPVLAQSMLALIEKVHAELESAAATATATGGTVLAREFFRDAVSRFQFQAGNPEGGVSMPALTAAADAAGNGVAGSPLSWLNITRIAFRFGLRSIASHNKHGLAVPKPNEPRAFQEINPGLSKQDLKKAIALDEIAEGIRAAQSLGLSDIFVKTDRATVSVPIASFDLAAIESWLRRPSDNPKVLPRPPVGVSFNRPGVDMTFEVSLTDRDLLKEYLEARGAIQVVVLRVGNGLDLGTKPVFKAGSTSFLSDIVAALPTISPSVGKADNTITVRPIYASQMTEADPGTFSYRVPAFISALELEWWHFELQPGAEKFWDEFASELGLEPATLLAPQAPGPNDAPSAGSGVPWVGGLGFKRGENPARVSKDLGNVAGRSRRPQ